MNLHYRLNAIGIMNFCERKILILLIFLSSINLNAQQLAFPSASGAGAYVTGGRGKPVYIVTNLNNSGSGSLRQAFEDAKVTDGGIITFAVSGTIELTSDLKVTFQNNLTIAGQTAPAGGITIVSSTDTRFEFKDVNNLIMRYIRFRTALLEYPVTEIDALYTYRVSNYIFDHCSISWGTDENADAGNGNNYTWQRNLFGESNKTGMIMGAEVEDSYDMSFVNNAFYNCSHRFPNWQSNGRVDVINNIVWGYRGLISSPYGTFNANHIGNYYEYFRDSPTSETYKRMMYYYYPVQGNDMPAIYTSGNYVSDILEDPNADNWLLWRWRFNPTGSIYDGAGNDSPLSTDLKSSEPFTQLGEPIIIKSFDDAFTDVTTDVGSNARLDESGNKITEIDVIDAIYLTNMQNQTLVDWTQDDVMNTPHRSDFLNTVSQTPINIHPTNFDTNNDGIPNQWLINKGIDINDDLTTYEWPSGYVGIEEYLNGVDNEPITNDVNASAGQDQNICDGQSTTLTASGGDTYLWNTGATTQSITVTPDTTTTYSVTAFIDSESDTDDVIVNVYDIPVANAGTDEQICDGETISLTASGGNSFLWSTGATSASINVSPNNTTTYSVSVTQNGCTDVDDVLVTVNPSPTANAGNDVSILEGESTTLTASGGDTYLWSTGETTASITVSPNATTTYTATTFINSCEDSDDVIVTVNTQVVANAGDDVTICKNSSTTLTASGGTDYLWSTGATTQSITISPNTTTTYSVTVSNENSSDTDDIVVTVDPNPLANAGSDVTISEGDNTMLVASGGGSYLWNTGETTQNITVSPNATTTYTVTAFINDCEDTDEVIVTVNTEVVANAGEDTVICDGASTILTASGGTDYLWNTGAATQSITVSPNTTTTYSVTVSNENSSDVDDVVVNVNPNPTANAGSDVTISEGENTTLIASGGNSYLWSTGETTETITVNPNATTTYTVIAILNGCEDSDDVIVTVEAEQVVANAGADVGICEGDSVTLTASGGTDYLWSTEETTQSIEVNPNSTTNYTVIVSNESSSDTDDVTVDVNPVPEVSLSNDATILAGNYITLSASGANNYEWSNGALQPNIAVSPDVTTTYVVTGYINNCYDVKYVTVSVVEQVFVDAGEDVFVCLGDGITLSASGSGAEDYLWNTGATSQSITVNPEEDTLYTIMASNSLDSDSDEIMVTVNSCQEEEILPEDEIFSFKAYIDSRISDEILNIKLTGLVGQSALYLFDISGKLIHTDEFDGNDGHEVVRTINKARISDGVYIIKVTNDNNDHSKSIIIQ
jgi:predicted transcriptional regulator